MARLIKIYDADWANRKKRPVHLDQTLWRVSPGDAEGPVSVLLALRWAAESRARMDQTGTGARQTAVAFCRAWEP